MKPRNNEPHGAFSVLLPLSQPHYIILCTKEGEKSGCSNPKTRIIAVGRILDPYVAKEFSFFKKTSLRALEDEKTSKPRGQG